MNSIDAKHLTRFLINTNQELIRKTAIKHCHAYGLHSFIINESPKIRLFIAESGCELNKNNMPLGVFNPGAPIIPIHPHKYDDLFITMSGVLNHHIYCENGKEPQTRYNVYSRHTLKAYTYRRLNDKHKIEGCGQHTLSYLGYKNDLLLGAKTLHTVTTEGETSWLIIETFKDDKFEQIAYHQNLLERPELYQEFKNEDPIDFINLFI